MKILNTYGASNLVTCLQSFCTVRRLVSKLQGLLEGKTLRLERVFRLTGHQRLDRLPQVFGLKHEFITVSLTSYFFARSLH